LGRDKPPTQGWKLIVKK